MNNPSPTLNLEIRHDVKGNPFFQVLTTKDTVRFYPGDIIEEVDLKRIVQNRTLTVNIKEPKA